MSLCNSIGTIDAQYRGEVKAMFYRNIGDKPYQVGDKIAQLVVPETLATQVRFVEVDELPSSDRGEGGFGSSGK
jgi:dUTP pyrophosphatase